MTNNHNLLHIMNKILSLTSALFLVSILSSFAYNGPLPTIPWICNEGQFEENVLFQARIFAGKIAVTRMGDISYTLYTENGRLLRIEEKLNTPSPVHFHGAEKAATKVHYFIGDQHAHKTGIPTFSSLETSEVWPGITVKAKAYNHNVEKIFSIQPGGKPEAIEIGIAGITDLCINESKELQVDFNEESVFFTPPLAWQIIREKRIMVPVQYKIIKTGSEYLYGFELQEYNKAFPVEIDPLLASTYFGGSGSDEVKKVLVDAQNRVYIIGKTKSTDIPVTANAYDQTYNAAATEYDAYVARLSPDLDEL
jgi:hypothetical protein